MSYTNFHSFSNRRFIPTSATSNTKRPRKGHLSWYKSAGKKPGAERRHQRHGRHRSAERSAPSERRRLASAAGRREGGHGSPSAARGKENSARVTSSCLFCNIDAKMHGGGWRQDVVRLSLKHWRGFLLSSSSRASRVDGGARRASTRGNNYLLEKRAATCLAGC